MERVGRKGPAPLPRREREESAAPREMESYAEGGVTVG
jgi:hypothetical protein